MLQGKIVQVSGEGGRREEELRIREFDGRNEGCREEDRNKGDRRGEGEEGEIVCLSLSPRYLQTVHRMRWSKIHHPPLHCRHCLV